MIKHHLILMPSSNIVHISIRTKSNKYCMCLFSNISLEYSIIVTHIEWNTHRGFQQLLSC